MKNNLNIHSPEFNHVVELDSPIDIITYKGDRLIGVTKTAYNYLTKCMTFYMGDRCYNDTLGNYIIIKK